ncbi:AMP-binding protein [uncultured Gilliamella sp.]|uniref:AMP-binding protein n=1 Tax=uncultured Gilliamella sp. TaxID=1193505 RepID=UPI0025DA4128|nr:AMP-binding protein [uncultured Gilliamella sp.]
MDCSSKTKTLVLLSEQLLRPDYEIIAYRKHLPLTVGDLKKLTNTIVSNIRKHPEKNWVLFMDDSFNFVAGLFALLYSGKHPLLLNPNYIELQHYYQAILTDIDIANINLPTTIPIIDINQLQLDGKISTINPKFKQPSLTLFTSGSTGLPKPIKKSIYQLEDEIAILINNLGAPTNDLFVASVSHEHMYGLTFKIMLSLSCKIPFVCETILYQEQLSTYQSKKITYITTPSIIKNLDNKLPIIKCEKVFSSGGKLSFDNAQSCLQNFNVLPCEIYGSSETGIIAKRKQKSLNTPWELFYPIQIKYTSDHQPLLISPLLQQAELLSDKLQKIDDTKFYLKGRIDKIVKIAEQRLSLTFIEKQINKLAVVEQVIVIPLEQNNRTILGAIIKIDLTNGKEIDNFNHFKLTQYFRHLLKDTLSLVEMPKKWRFIRNFPKNSQGKCTYTDLKALFDATDKI